eukprot:scaffold5636_cov73-Cyclotella_meneghiniana.AAC.9
MAAPFIQCTNLWQVRSSQPGIFDHQRIEQYYHHHRHRPPQFDGRIQLDVNVVPGKPTSKSVPTMIDS